MVKSSQELKDYIKVYEGVLPEVSCNALAKGMKWEYEKNLTLVLDTFINLYMMEFGIREGTLKLEAIEFGGEAKSEHYDSGLHKGIVRSPIQAVLILTDDYEGGELEFMNQGVKLKIPKGAMVVFPANFMFPHKVHEFTGNRKGLYPIYRTVNTTSQGE